MDRCAPGLAWGCKFVCSPATPLVAGRARSGSGRSCDLVRCVSPVRARVRLLLLSLSGDGYPRCLFFFTRDLCDSRLFVEPVLGERESMEFFAANCKLQVECGCGNGRADKNGRRSSPHYSVASVRFQRHWRKANKHPTLLGFLQLLSLFAFR